MIEANAPGWHSKGVAGARGDPIRAGLGRWILRRQKDKGRGLGSGDPSHSRVGMPVSIEPVLGWVELARQTVMRSAPPTTSFPSEPQRGRRSHASVIDTGRPSCRVPGGYLVDRLTMSAMSPSPSWIGRRIIAP